MGSINVGVLASIGIVWFGSIKLHFSFSNNSNAVLQKIKKTLKRYNRIVLEKKLVYTCFELVLKAMIAEKTLKEECTKKKFFNDNYKYYSVHKLTPFQFFNFCTYVIFLY